jgi:hypothetical protein
MALVEFSMHVKLSTGNISNTKIFRKLRVITYFSTEKDDFKLVNVKNLLPLERGLPI